MVDDRDRRCIGGVPWIEFAPRDQASLHRLEPSRAHGIKIGARRILRGRRWFAFGENDGPGLRNAERDGVAERVGLDARHRAKLGHQAVLECLAPLLGVTIERDVEHHRHCVPGIEADVDGHRTLQTPDHQYGANEQHERQRHLRAD